MGQKLGISQPTMARIERGDPSVAMASYVMCMWLINQAGGPGRPDCAAARPCGTGEEVAKVKTKRKTQPKPTQVFPASSLRLVNIATPQRLQSAPSPASAGLAALLAKSAPKKQ